ncbi:enoyl-CoA hydratase/isomerase family protein [Myroides sp. LJL116]
MKENSTNIQLNVKDKVATISFYSPASNSFPSSLLNQLSQQIDQLEQNPEITTVILKSEGEGAFCAGASFDELLQITTKEQGHIFFNGFAKVINSIRKSSKIFIARVHGKTVGGGVGLVASCDYAFATDQAFIKLSELAIGIGPFVIEPAVSRKIGKMAMSEMTLEAHSWKSSSWAFEKGLYNELFHTTDQMDQSIEEFSKRVSSYNPQALQQMKLVFWEGTSNWDELLTQRATISGELVLSDFTKNALEQFKKK